ncbi:MAG: histidine kinase N-terminal 7TM domain-containing protein, partial [Bacteroidota bacterium]
MNLDPIAPLMLIFFAALALGLTGFLRSRIPGALSLIVLAFCLALWSAAYVIEMRYPFPGSARAGIAIVYLCMTVAASAQFIFCLTYTRRTLWVSRPATLLLAVMPVLSQLLFWLKPAHAFFFSGPSAQLLSPLPLVGTWARLNALYIYTLVGASVLILLETFSRKPRSLFLNSWPIPFLGAALPLLVEMLNGIGLRTAVAIDPSLFSFTLAGIGFTYGLFNRRLIESVPVTRERVVEAMDDGWVVLNADRMIVDTNPAAERMIGIPREKAYGQPLSAILGDLPNMGNIFEGARELEMKRSIKSQEGWRYLNIRLSGLADDHDGKFGHLIVWRDITERRLAEDARQRARDEMFVLLNA